MTQNSQLALIGVKHHATTERLPFKSQNTVDRFDTEITHGSHVVRAGVLIKRNDGSAWRFVDVEFSFGIDGAAMTRFVFDPGAGIARLNPGELWDLGIVLLRASNGDAPNKEVEKAARMVCPSK